RLARFDDALDVAFVIVRQNASWIAATALDVAFVIVCQNGSEITAAACACINTLVGEAVEAARSISSVVDLAPGARRDETDVFVGSQQDGSAGRNQRTTTGIAEAFNLDQTLVDLDAGIAGGFNGYADLRAAHKD